MTAFEEDFFAPYRGIGQFGPAYRRMMEHDTHAPGSVDRVLTENMVRVCDQTAHLFYQTPISSTSAYVTGSRPTLETYISSIRTASQDPEQHIAGIVNVCQTVIQNSPDSLDAMRFGGTEEQIIERGTDWCTDIARVACVLCQVAGLPARLIYMANLKQAYSAHAIIEAWRNGQWGAVDPIASIIYQTPDGSPATTWQLMSDPDLIESHRSSDHTGYCHPDQFLAAAVADYPVQNHNQYDYTTSTLNNYYRSILEQAQNGWLNGPHWLHGEDSTP